MLNIVLDTSEVSNVWYTRKPPNKGWFMKKLPTFLHDIDITIHNSADNLDTFIYPVLMHEPYIQVRSLIQNYSHFGFWSLVPDSVIQGLREKRGWIIIDLYSEPIVKSDFQDLIRSLSEPSEYPNDRILLNTVVPQFVDNKKVFDFPSYLELSCYVNHIEFCYGACPGCFPSANKDLEYPHKRFLLLNNHIDYHLATLLAKYASEHPNSFLDSSNTILGKTALTLPQALYATDINVVPEAYVNFDIIDYPFITEKTFRNVKYKKPFIVMGQQHLLASFRELGYKTFHPLIDESYDEVDSERERFVRVVGELERLRQMRDTKFNNLLQQCQPIVEHNYNNLITRMNQTKPWLVGLKKV